jgi:hypothetical protein
MVGLGQKFFSSGTHNPPYTKMSDYEEYNKKNIVILIASGTAILHAKDGLALPKLKADIYDHYYFE